MALLKKEADTAEWQAAIESLMLVAELGGPTMFARIGVMRAYHFHEVSRFRAVVRHARSSAKCCRMFTTRRLRSAKVLGRRQHRKKLWKL